MSERLLKTVDVESLSVLLEIQQYVLPGGVRIRCIYELDE